MLGCEGKHVVLTFFSVPKITVIVAVWPPGTQATNPPRVLRYITIGLPSWAFGNQAILAISRDHGGSMCQFTKYRSEPEKNLGLRSRSGDGSVVTLCFLA